MSSSAVGNAAVESTQAIIYQLYVAVQKCFEMTAGQSVFIEKYGDVTVSGSSQIEVKVYGDNLTDGHLNLWKTIGNWMRPEFDETKYATLVLLTTQPIGPNSRLEEWNKVTSERRLSILEEIVQESEQRFAARVADHGSAKPALPVPEVLEIQRRLLQSTNATKLLAVIDRMCIASGSPGMEDFFTKMKQRYCKGVLIAKQDDVCALLLGFVATPPMVNKSDWEISYEEFTAKCADLHSQYCKETKRFPTKYRRPHSGPTPPIPAKRFVKNIHDIDYADVVPKAVKDYLYASDTVAKDFAAYERPPENYQVFADAVLDQFHPLYRTAKRDLAAKVDGAKGFYDQMMMMPIPSFPGFEPPDASFRNGVIHMHQDDESQGLSWKLT